MITGMNYLFDRGILKSYTFNVPIIAVGNLSVGGTGKTPQIEYLIDCLKTSVATLSRGIRESLKGFVIDASSNAEILATNRFSFYEFKTSKWPLMQIRMGFSNCFHKRKARSDITR
jgi:hypothetical protein